MKTVNMHEAKTHLSRLVEAATKGEPFIIARAGKPLVEVRAVETATTPQRHPERIGFLEGRFAYDEAVDKQLDDEIRQMFEESIDRPLDFGCDPEDETGGDGTDGQAA
jgi:prevent-host-death family protein